MSNVFSWCVRGVVGGCLLLSLTIFNANARADEPVAIKALADSEGKEVSVKFEVKSSYFDKKREMVYLNSESDHKSDENFTILLRKSGIDAFKEKSIDDPAAHFKGKTILVKGTVKIYKKKPQIQVDSADQITEPEADK